MIFLFSFMLWGRNVTSELLKVIYTAMIFSESKTNGPITTFNVYMYHDVRVFIICVTTAIYGQRYKLTTVGRASRGFITL